MREHLRRGRDAGQATAATIHRLPVPSSFPRRGRARRRVSTGPGALGRAASELARRWQAEGSHRDLLVAGQTLVSMLRVLRARSFLPRATVRTRLAALLARWLRPGTLSWTRAPTTDTSACCGEVRRTIRPGRRVRAARRARERLHRHRAERPATRVKCIRSPCPTNRDSRRCIRRITARWPPSFPNCHPSVDRSLSAPRSRCRRLFRRWRARHVAGRSG